MFQPAPASAFSVAGLVEIDTTGTTFNRIFSQQAFPSAVDLVGENIIVITVTAIIIIIVILLIVNRKKLNIFSVLQFSFILCCIAGLFLTY